MPALLPPPRRRSRPPQKKSSLDLFQFDQFLFFSKRLTSKLSWNVTAVWYREGLKTIENESQCFLFFPLDH